MPAETGLESLVVAVDGGHASLDAARCGAAVANWMGLSPHLVAVSFRTAADLIMMKARDPEEVEVARARATSCFPSVEEATPETVWVKHSRIGEIGPECAAVCRETGAALLVVGRRNLGRIMSLVLGRVSLDIIRASTAPVMVVPVGTELSEGPPKWLVTTDLSEVSKASFGIAGRLARGTGAELVVVHVAEEGANLESLERRVKGFCEGLLKDLPRSRVRILEGIPSEALGAAVKEESPSAVICASHGRSGLARVLLGSVAEGLLAAVSCPMVIVRAPDEALHSE